MGKPSSTHLSKSKHSMNYSMSNKKINVSMRSQKLANKKRKGRDRSKNNIRKLFQTLRSESQHTSNASSETSVVVLDDTKTPKSNKRKQSPCDQTVKRGRKENDSLILIDDDSVVITNNDSSHNPITPRTSATIQCSTPIAANDKKGSQDLIISNFSTYPNNNCEIASFNKEVNDLTKEINRDSYVTIDLTTETLNSSGGSRTQNTVIDLVNTSEAPDFIPIVDNNETRNSLLSSESDVTVNRNKNVRRTESQMRKFASGIANLDASEKGRLLELIMQNIFSGCNVPDRVKGSIQTTKESTTRATETAEDAYIKEVILGQTSSRNSIGSNIYNPERDLKNKSGLRMIVIDGSNVAMAHGMGGVFSVKGLKICIDYFQKRGHAVKAFVPRFRCKFGKSSDPRQLDELERRGLVVYTPSREVQGRLIVPYDDRYIVQCAAEFDGVIVSGDNYRDLLCENPRWRRVIEDRLLQFTWVRDMIMFPRDPLGRTGPSLEAFLKHPTPPQRYA